MEVFYCVVKKLELSSEYLGRYCKQLVESVLFYNVPSYSSCKLQFFHGMIEESAFYHCGHNRLHNAFPNGKMEIICLGKYDLFDPLNMDCKV